MNPFSLCLREIRLTRNLLQKEMAMLIGYEQSYVSALETGIKGAPKRQFINQLIKKLELNEEEESKLLIAAEKSRKVFKLPKHADFEMFELCYQFEQQLPSLTEIQMNLINLALKINHHEKAELQNSSISKLENSNQ